jgi:hypothetical protein
VNARRVALWLAWLLPFSIYLFSAYRDVGYWDVGEMDTVPWILGIAHPTGFPAFVLGGWLFSHAVPIGSVAFRMSLFSSLAMSLAGWFVARTIAEEREAPWIGMACAWLFALGDVAWTRATRAEVHALAALAIAATLYFALRWYRTHDERSFLCGAGAWALGIATHPVAALLLPGLLVLLIARLHRLSSRTLLGAIGLFCIVVVAFYAYLPLRSAYVSAHAADPTLALGVPAGRPFWDYDHPSTVDGFRALVSGSDFDVADGARSIVNPGVYQRGAPKYGAALLAEFTWIGVGLIVAGIVAAFLADRVRTVALVLCGFVCVPFALGYPDEADAKRYFLTSFVVGAIFAGEAGVWLAARVRWARVATVGAMVLASAWLVWTQRHLFTQPHDARAAAAADTILLLTEPNAVIIANWSYATPLAYEAYVEHRFGARTIDAAWLYDDADFVPEWAKSHTIYVAGEVSGEVDGFHPEQISARPPLFRLVRDP